MQRPADRSRKNRAFLMAYLLVSAHLTDLQYCQGGRAPAAGQHGRGVRSGEANHPGPADALDDPEAFDWDELDEERAVVEVDGAFGLDMMHVETDILEQQGRMGPEQADLGIAAATADEDEAMDRRTARPWWDIRLGEEVTEDDGGIE